jgi:hypothetical protein
MSGETRQLLRICEQLPQAQRVQVTNYARSLLGTATSTQGPPAEAQSASPLEALGAVQTSLGLTPQAAREWAADTAARRSAWGRAG